MHECSLSRRRHQSRSSIEPALPRTVRALHVFGRGRRRIADFIRATPSGVARQRGSAEEDGSPGDRTALVDLPARLPDPELNHRHAFCVRQELGFRGKREPAPFQTVLRWDGAGSTTVIVRAVTFSRPRVPNAKDDERVCHCEHARERPQLANRARSPQPMTSLTFVTSPVREVS
jgi:hypothetical protein